MTSNKQLTGRGGRPVSAELLSAMNEESVEPGEDKLERVRRELGRARTLEMEVENLRQRLTEKSAMLLEMKQKTLVDIFDEARVSKLGIPPEGNVPGYEIEIRPYYKANIPVEWPKEQRAEAFGWLTEHGHGDLLRQTVTVSFGPKTIKAQRALAAFLKKNKMDWSSEYGVPWNTLTAWLKNEIEVNKRTPPLDLLGATVGRVASVVKQKEK